MAPRAPEGQRSPERAAELKLREEKYRLMLETFSPQLKRLWPHSATKGWRLLWRMSTS